MEKTVVVGMSGGVDSSVSALLLKQQGYRVIGLHMKSMNSVSADTDRKSAEDVCKKIGIDFVCVDYKDEMDKVKDYFIGEYKIGRTPNPCVLCNREVKFKPFVDYMNQIGADYFATGHYANIEHTENGHFLVIAKDEDKDQTYFLNQLSQEQLSKVLFPLGSLTKDEVRKIAEQNGLVNAHKKDSFDVCFVGSQKFKDYMKQVCPQKCGDIIDIDSGKVVGRHNGLNVFTYGQRKGLSIGGQKDILGRWFVVKKDLENNILYVSTNEQKYLFSATVICGNFNWIKQLDNSADCFAKIRYRQANQKVSVEVLDDQKVKLSFENPQRAATLGQYAVLYQNGYCLGGGVIEEVC